MKRELKTPSKAKLDAMVDEATVDCNNESEQATGLFTMIEEHLALPFETLILGAPVAEPTGSSQRKCPRVRWCASGASLNCGRVRVLAR
jgi:hypothetical protein